MKHLAIVGLVLFSIIFWNGPTFADGDTILIADIQIAPIGSRETVTLVTSGKIEPRVYTLSDPTRLVIDIANATLVPGILQLPHESPWMNGVRASQFLVTPPTVRVVLDLKGKVSYQTVAERTSFSIQFLESGRGVAAAVEPPLTEQLQGLLTRANFEMTELEKKRWPSEVFWETTAQTIEALPIALREVIATPSMAMLGTPLPVEQRRGDLSALKYARLEEIGEIIGASYEFQKSTGTANFSLGQITQISVRAGEKRVFVNGEMRELPAPVEAAETKTGYELIAPVFAFAELLGLSSAEATPAEIALVPQIIKVSFEKNDGSEKIVLQLSGPIGDLTSEFYPGRTRVDFILPHVRVAEHLKIVPIHERSIRFVKLFLREKTKTRVIISHDGAKPFLLLPVPEKNQIVLLYGPALSSIRLEKQAQGQTLLAFSDQPLHPEINFLENPSRLVIDIPGHILNQRKLREEAAHLPPTLRLRGAQNSLDPLQVRLVIDLVRPTKYFYRTDLHGKRLRVTLISRRGLTAAQMKALQFSKVLQGRVIAIEAGHGGDDPGSMGLAGQPEKEYTLQSALSLARQLSQLGAIPLLTREKDVRVKLSDVVNLVNSNRVDVFLSIHYNAFVEDRIGGTETYYFTRKSERLAEAIHRHLLTGIRRADRGIRRAMFYTVHHAQVPSILIEPLYLTHPEEGRLVQKAKFHQELAWDIIRGLKEYFGGRVKQLG